MLLVTHGLGGPVAGLLTTGLGVASVASRDAAGIAAASAVGEPAATRKVGLTLAGVASSAVAGVPSFSRVVRLAAASVVGAATLGSPTVSTAGKTTLTVSGIASTASVGTATATRKVALAPAGVSPASSAGSPAVSVSGLAQRTAAGLAGLATTGAPSAARKVQLDAAGVAPSSAAGSPVARSRGQTDPSVRAAIVRLFHEADSLMSLCPGGLTLNEADRLSPMPYATLHGISAANVRYNTGRGYVRDHRFQVSLRGEDPDVLEELSEAVQGVFHHRMSPTPWVNAGPVVYVACQSACLAFSEGLSANGLPLYHLPVDLRVQVSVNLPS